ncbi:type I-E CRISPR-associated protein Cas7/Cse4/CasC [candidate division KSB1 bacterium]|nr:type I-E CRISPR-associated protein Cas7/Cse4/CasC [candidate division KSB1 bacterium]
MYRKNGQKPFGLKKTLKIMKKKEEDKMFVELHMLQNFPPHCLNRDDTNQPKDCEFGGYRRARISSQCLKRAIRKNPKFQENLKGHLSKRSLRFPSQIHQYLIKEGIEENAAKKAANQFAKIAKKESGGGESDEKDVMKTPQIMFFTDEEVEFCAKKVINAIEKNEDIIKIIRKFKDKEKSPQPRNADIALFGRMITSDAFKDIHAACQVAHAISTNQVNMEMDFYTAVDDLNPEGETGAGMMGVVGFNSSCFYRYSCLDTGKLLENLGGDNDLCQRTIEAYMRASVAAIPTGKQNSMAAQNLPSLIFAVVRNGGSPWSLANAFEKPVYPDKNCSLVQKSISALDNHWGNLCKVYGSDHILAKPVVIVGEVELKNLVDSKKETLDELISETMNAVSFQEE